MESDTAIFAYDKERKQWIFEWDGKIHAFDTFMDAATKYNALRFER